MSSPIVYLGFRYAGKTLAFKTFLYSGHKTVLIRKNKNILAMELESKTHSTISYTFTRYMCMKDTGEIAEFKSGTITNKMQIDFDPDTRIKGPNKKKPGDRGMGRFIPPPSEGCDISYDQMSTILSKHTDAHAWIYAMNLLGGEQKYSDEMFEFFSSPLFRNCKFLIPYRKYRITNQLLHYLSEGYFEFDVYEEARTFMDAYFREYEQVIKTLEKLGLSYELTDISDPNHYTNMGCDPSDVLEYDPVRRIFTSDDPAFDKFDDTDKRAKLMLDRANQYVNDRKDYLTSLFPDIVL